MPVNRREFLKMVGSGTLMSVLLPLLPREALAQIEEALTGGVETSVRSVCQQCPAGCGILVRCIGGWPVKIEGNPLHPVNQGTLCPLGFTGLFTFYDPDRIKTPLKRVGPRGANQWEPISWDEAVKQTVDALSELKKNNRSAQLSIIDGEYRGLMRVLFENFAAAFDTPNYYPADFSPIQGPVEAIGLTQGLKAEPSYDIANAGTVFIFNSNILEAGSSPAEVQRAWGRMRRGRKGKRGRAVYIGPRLSITAGKADEWVPVKPGTEGILALGLAHVLIKESLVDNQFVDNNCDGFYGEKNARSFILSEFTPYAVSEKTGVGIPTLFRLAREFVRQKPSVAISVRGLPPVQHAVHLLNALAGSINVVGGVLIPRKIDYGKWNLAETSPQARLVSEVDSPDLMSQLASKFFSGEPTKTNALFLYYSNPVFSSSYGEKIREGLSRIPFIVSFSPFMDETTALADLILPDRTFLERSQDVPTSTLDGYPVFGISQPIRKTLHDTRHSGDVMLAIASGLELKLPWPDFQALLDDGLKRVFDFGKGDVFGDETETSWTKLLERSGWWSPAYETLDEFKKLVRERGGWWDPSYTASDLSSAVATASGKFMFGDVPGIGHLSPEGGDPDYPLQLEVFRVLPWLKSRTANQPWLSDIAGPHLFERWHTWAEINPKTAEELKIADGDEIWVISTRGKVKAVARIYQGIMPDVVAMPMGLGHTSGGRYSEGLGSNPRGIACEDGRITRVRVEKA